MGFLYIKKGSKTTNINKMKIRILIILIFDWKIPVYTYRIYSKFENYKLKEFYYNNKLYF